MPRRIPERAIGRSCCMNGVCVLQVPACIQRAGTTSAPGHAPGRFLACSWIRPAAGGRAVPAGPCGCWESSPSRVRGCFQFGPMLGWGPVLLKTVGAGIAKRKQNQRSEFSTRINTDHLSDCRCLEFLCARLELACAILRMESRFRLRRGSLTYSSHFY